MTEKASGFLVTFDKDVHDEDVDQIATMLGMIRGVASVQPVPAEPFAQQIERARVDAEWHDELIALLRRRIVR